MSASTENTLPSVYTHAGRTNSDAHVETNVSTALRSKSPSKRIVQLLDAEPPGEHFKRHQNVT